MDAPNEPMHIARLIALHLSREISEAQQAELDRWINSSERNARLFGEITDPESLALALGELEQTDTALALSNVKERIADMEQNNSDSDRGKLFRLLKRAAVAAVIVLTAGIGSYWILQRPSEKTVAVVMQPGVFKNDVLPGNKAFLTLANGKQIAVSGLPAGKIAETDMQKSKDGTITVGNTGITTALVYNTFTVPRGGGRHSLVLSDGTTVMLDAGSSLKFPVSFPGTERSVELTGQAYFEVAHQSAQPFRVHVNGTTIEDVGTHFNINAFGASVKTTLLEGAVRVSDVLLKPGQQAVQRPGETVRVNDHVDMEAVMAWKNDLFKFSDNSTLPAVMEELGRWYGLEIIYAQNGPHKSNDYHFSGYLSRKSKLSDILKILQSNGAQFSIDGNKLFVYP